MPLNNLNKLFEICVNNNSNEESVQLTLLHFRHSFWGKFGKSQNNAYNYACEDIRNSKYLLLPYNSLFNNK